jgi:ribosomal protein S6--L-glutamate ligase
MRLITFNPYRTLEIDNALYIKPEAFFSHLHSIAEADWLLFPEYWQINALLYGLKKRIFPSPASYYLGHTKVEMTRAFWAVCPKHAPFTLIRGSGASALEEIQDALTFPFVAKEIRNSMGRGVHLIDNRSDLLHYAGSNDVLYVQELLPIQRDLRVVWVGDSIVTAYWRQAPEGGFQNNVAQGGEIYFDGVPQAALDLVAKTARQLSINHAGFDLAEVAGHWYFLEFNVFFGNQALSAQNLKLGPRILDYLASQGNSQKIPPVKVATDSLIINKFNL